jgi:hypothetical protein
LPVQRQFAEQEQRESVMTAYWSNPIPQALQQHGSPPKRAPELAPPLQPKLEDLAPPDKAAAFASPVFVPAGLKTS